MLEKHLKEAGLSTIEKKESISNSSQHGERVSLVVSVFELRDGLLAGADQLRQGLLT